MRGGFDDGATTTVVRWTPGTVTKVVIAQIEPSPAFTVQGFRCSDGKVLRFWYQSGLPPVGFGPGATPVPSSVLESIGSAAVDFEADPNVAPPQRINFKLGYTLFTSSGLWRVEARAGDKLLGTAIVQVLAV